MNGQMWIWDSALQAIMEEIVESHPLSINPFQDGI